MSSFKDLLAEDPQYQKFIEISQSVRETLTLDRFLKEAEVMHKGRKVRTLNARKISPIDLQEAIIADLGNRSRLTEIRTLLARQSEILGTALSTIKRHLRAKHADYLKSRFSTVSERNSFLDVVLAKPRDILSQVESAEDMLELYVKDLDQASFSYRNSLELLKMILDRRGTENL